MKKNQLYALLLMMIAVIPLSAQQKLKVYDRASISYLILNTPEKESFALFKENYLKVDPSPKFDVNQLDNRVISVPAGTSINENTILEQLNNSGIGQQILANWVSFDEKGHMNTTLFMERGLYNANDEDVLKAMAMKRDLAYVKDYGENLIQKSYVIVVELEEIFKKNEITRREQIKALKQGKLKGKISRKGCFLKIKAYLYKIDFDDEKRAEFYQSCWINEDDTEDVKSVKVETFKNFKLGFKFIAANEVSSKSFKGKKSFPISLFIKEHSFEKIMTDLVEKNYEKSLRSFDKHVEDLQVKVPVYNIRPIQAKIGKKEDLRINQRYFAYENTQYINNEIKLKHVGVVRAKRPTDNRQIATGNMHPSKFIQIWGTLKPGMLLVQKPDIGFNVSGGYQLGEHNEGLYWQIDYLLGRWAKWFPISNLYISYQSVLTKYERFERIKKEHFSFISLQRPICVAKNLKLTPYFGFTRVVINTGLINFGAGAKLSYAIRHNIHIGAFSTYFNFRDLPTDGYPKRSGLNYGFNLQFSF